MMKSLALLLTTLLATVAAARVDPPPTIVSMWLSQPSAHRGDVVRGRVVASKNTASVEVRIGGYGSSMKKIDATTFVIAYRVPWVPFFLHRSWTVRVIARNTAGVATERDTAIAIR